MGVEVKLTLTLSYGMENEKRGEIRGNKLACRSLGKTVPKIKLNHY